MRVVCIRCKKEYGQKDPKENGSVTHGICPECLKEIRKKGK